MKSISIFLPLLLLFPLSSAAFGLFGKAAKFFTGGSQLTIRGQLFCNEKPIGGRVTLHEEDIVIHNDVDEVDILIPSKYEKDPSLAATCGSISQFYLHGEEDEFDGAEWFMKIQPKCNDNPFCEQEFKIDWAARSMKGKQTFVMNKIDVCSEEHRRIATEEPMNYVGFSSGIKDDWDNDRK